MEQNKRRTGNKTVDIEEARKAARRKKRMRKKIVRVSIVLTVLLVLVLLIAFLVIRISGTIAKKNGKTISFLGVKSIEVVGDTRYSDEEIIKASGIYVGESLLVVNKVEAHNAILSAFPYLDHVDVGNASFSTVRITVQETAVMGAVCLPDGSYMILGENNHALEQVNETALPAGCVRLTGAKLKGTDPGEALLEERDLQISQTLLQGASAVGLEHITVIDLTDKTGLFFVWNGQILVKLGNSSNLAVQVQTLHAMLPTLLKNNGETACGSLDMTTYADDDPTNDKAIFTPKSSPEELFEPRQTVDITSTSETGSTEATATQETAAETGAAE